MNCKSSILFDEDVVFRCEREENHKEGLHQATGNSYGQWCLITWTGGMPQPCTRCGVEKHPSDLIVEHGEALCSVCWVAEYDKDDDA